MYLKLENLTEFFQHHMYFYAISAIFVCVCVHSCFQLSSVVFVYIRPSCRAMAVYMTEILGIGEMAQRLGQNWIIGNRLVEVSGEYSRHARHTVHV